MTRAEALAEIRRRAHREHGTAVRALTLILDVELAGIRECVTVPAGSDRDAGYVEGMGNAADLIEEALFTAFNVWPDGGETAGGARGHR